MVLRAHTWECGSWPSEGFRAIEKIGIIVIFLPLHSHRKGSRLAYLWSRLFSPATHGGSTPSPRSALQSGRCTASMLASACCARPEETTTARAFEL